MIQQTIRAVAGIFILLSLALAQVHSPYWYLLTGFVGLNLFQSAFTRWCLLEGILKKFMKNEQTLKELTCQRQRP